MTDRPDGRADRIDAALALLARRGPPGIGKRSFADWLRMLIEDLLVIERGDDLTRATAAAAPSVALDVIDGRRPSSR